MKEGSKIFEETKAAVNAGFENSKVYDRQRLKNRVIVLTAIAGVSAVLLYLNSFGAGGDLSTPNSNNNIVELSNYLDKTPENNKYEITIVQDGKVTTYEKKDVKDNYPLVGPAPTVPTATPTR